jgi:signal transduction histidine kinase
MSTPTAPIVSQSAIALGPLPKAIDHWRTLKLLEWFLIATVIALQATRPNFYYNSAASIISTCLTMTVMFLLSLKPPIRQSIGKQRAYILFSIVITIIGDGVLNGFTVLTYFVLLKACLLLPRRDVIGMAVISGVLLLIGTAIRSPAAFAIIRQQGIEAFLDEGNLLVRVAIAYFSSCIFVILPGFALVEEQRSRRRAEQLSQQVETLAADLERSRIARDIHDALGHSLTTLDVQLELAQNLYGQEPQRAAKSIDIAKKLSSKCLQDVRYALHAMHRSNFDLNQASLTLIEQFNHSQKLKIHHYFNFPKLPLQASYQLYCIVQEALTNIQKHAAASQVDIKGAEIDGNICLTIEDNGQGFDRQVAHAGFGLQNMRDRIHSLGGQFEIYSEVQGGTQLRVLVPLGMSVAVSSSSVQL